MRIRTGGRWERCATVPSPSGCFLGLLVVDPWASEERVARALYAGAGDLVRQLGAEEVIASGARAVCSGGLPEVGALPVSGTRRGTRTPKVSGVYAPPVGETGHGPGV